MLLDWFTTIAQIVNFLVLIWLLKKFLYGPIVRAMDAREQTIADRLDAAEQRQQEARAQKDEFERKTHELDEQREELLNEARTQADTRRAELERQARADAEQLRANWQESLRRDKDTFLRELRRRAGHNACSAARRVLDEMADAQLEQRMIDVWQARISALDDERTQELNSAARDAEHGLVVRSAFALTEDRRAQITRLLQDIVADEVELSFETDAEIVCGIELRAGSFKLAWSVADYLRGLEQSVAELIDDAAQAEESS